MNELTITQEKELGIFNIMPKMDKIELFNQLDDAQPLSELTNKEFVQVPKNKRSEDDIKNNIYEENPDMVERLRLTLITDLGMFKSFSIFFNSAIEKAIIMFGALEFQKHTYRTTIKIENSKSIYKLQIVA
jgi:hypothetical protein